MMDLPRLRVAGCIAALLIAVALAGCGRRADPERPPIPPGSPPQVPINPDNPTGQTAPDRPFFLDPLVKGTGPNI